MNVHAGICFQPGLACRRSNDLAPFTKQVDNWHSAGVKKKKKNPICCGNQMWFLLDMRLFPRYGFMLSRLSHAVVAGSLLARSQRCSSPLCWFKEFIFSWSRAQGGSWIGQRGSGLSIDTKPSDSRRLNPGPKTEWRPCRFDTREPNWTGLSSAIPFMSPYFRKTELFCGLTLLSAHTHSNISNQSAVLFLDLHENIKWMLLMPGIKIHFTVHPRCCHYALTLFNVAPVENSMR